MAAPSVWVCGNDTMERLLPSFAKLRLHDAAPQVPTGMQQQSRTRSGRKTRAVTEAEKEEELETLGKELTGDLESLTEAVSDEEDNRIDPLDELFDFADLSDDELLWCDEELSEEEGAPGEAGPSAVPCRKTSRPSSSSSSSNTRQGVMQSEAFLDAIHTWIDVMLADPLPRSQMVSEKAKMEEALSLKYELTNRQAREAIDRVIHKRPEWYAVYGHVAADEFERFYAAMLAAYQRPDVTLTTLSAERDRLVEEAAARSPMHRSEIENAVERARNKARSAAFAALEARNASGQEVADFRRRITHANPEAKRVRGDKTVLSKDRADNSLNKILGALGHKRGDDSKPRTKQYLVGQLIEHMERVTQRGLAGRSRKLVGAFRTVLAAARDALPRYEAGARRINLSRAETKAYRDLASDEGLAFLRAALQRSVQ